MVSHFHNSSKSRLDFRSDGLASGKEFSPRVFLELLKSLRQVLNIEHVGASLRVELVPSDRNGDRCPAASPCRVGRDCRRTTLVPQVIHKDLTSAFGLAHRREISV